MGQHHGTVVITGASGNIGTGVLRVLRAQAPDLVVRAVCRRPPPAVPPYDRADWTVLDLTAPDAAVRLATVCRGADAVVHLAWAIQPVRDEPGLRRTNLGGTAAVLRAVRAAGVPHLVYASSTAVYGPPSEEPVREDWPATGRRTSAYSRLKVLTETMLDGFAAAAPDIVVTLIRPTLVVQRDAAVELGRLALGRAPSALLSWAERAGLLRVLPAAPGTPQQLVHADDVGRAVAAILERTAGGAFNLAAEPIDAAELADALRARPVPVPRSLVRGLFRAFYGLHVLPLSGGWFDLGADTPVVSTERARRELGWTPTTSSTQAVRILFDGLADRAAGISPALREPPL